MTVPVLSPVAVAAAGPSPLQAEFAKAISRGEHDKVRALIARGVNVNNEIGGFVPIMLAKDAEMVSLLASAGANINATGTLLPGQTALMSAAMEGNEAVVDALLEAGADVNRVNAGSGGTALQMAISEERVKTVKILIEAGADVNAGRFLGFPPLHFAVMKGNEEIVRMLLAAGADTELRDDSGATAVETATHLRRKKILKLLVDAGADVNTGGGPGGGTGSTHKKAGKERKGTLMDLAVATGDPDIIDVLRKAGAKKSKRPPLPDKVTVNPPGRYSLECSIKDPPPVSAKDVSCSEEGQVVAKGVETIVVSSAYYQEGRPVPKEEGCEVDLGLPGTYTVRQWRTKMKWRQVCKYRLRGVGVESWLVTVRKDEPDIKRMEYKITIGGSGKKPAEKEEKRPPSVRIVKPAGGEQFSFDVARPGVLEIEAEAVVEGDCDSPATWKVEDVAGSEKRLMPEEPSDTVKIRYEGLPMENDAFGRKKITASACGKSDSVTVEVFFDPKAKNHPGEGEGETPNWFYYWGQTSAGKGFSPSYMKAEPCGSKAVGAYFFDQNKIYLFSKMYDGVCFRRNDGAQAKGIDCYAETLIHESIHQKELRYWWNNVPSSDSSLISYFIHNWNFILTDGPKPSTCTIGVWELLERKFRNWIASVDSDGDLVPNYIEKALAGCDPGNPFSCAGVPAHVMMYAQSIGHKIDVDMNTYRISWKKWKIGSADEEDWSRCGKQWKDRSVCSR